MFHTNSLDDAKVKPADPADPAGQSLGQRSCCRVPVCLGFAANFVWVLYLSQNSSILHTLRTTPPTHQPQTTTCNAIHIDTLTSTPNKTNQLNIQTRPNVFLSLLRKLNTKLRQYLLINRQVSGVLIRSLSSGKPIA